MFRQIIYANSDNNTYINSSNIKYDEKVILPNINKIINNDFILKDEFKSNIYKVKTDQLIKFIYFIIFYECLFLILIDKRVIDRKQKLFFPLLISTLLIFYSIIIHSVNLKIYYLEQQFLALMLILFIFIKFYRYE